MKRRKYSNVSPSTVLLMRQIIIGMMIVAFFGMLTISVWYGTRVEAFTISKVTVEGGETIPHEQLESIVRRNLDGAYLKLIPRAFSLFYPHEAIETEIRQIRKIKDLQIVKVSQSELRLEFTEYSPDALWCKDSETEGCFFLDDTGYSFSSAPQLSGGAFLRLIAIGKQPTEHTHPFLIEDYQKINELVRRLRESDWDISRVDVDAARDAFFTVTDGGELKISLKQSADETMENFLTVIGSEKFTHVKPGNFEYIDLRFGNKVFVNEVTTVTDFASADSSATTSTEASALVTVPEEEVTTVVPPLGATTSVTLSESVVSDEVIVEIDIPDTVDAEE